MKMQYPYWEEDRWYDRREQLATGWGSMPEEGKRNLIGDLILHAYEVVPADETYQVEHQKIY